MENRIMQVFYGNDCLPYKDSARKVHYPIVGNSFLGANNTTEIRFYVRDIGGVNNVSWVAVSKLPNGKVGSEVLSTIQFDSELHEYYVVLNLSSYYTQMKGDVYISLNGYQGEIQVSQDANTGIYTIEGTPIIEATGSIKLSINYAPQVPQGQHFNISDLQQILGAISEKANVFSTIQIISDITQEDLSGYEDGQLFYDTYYNTYYQKNSLNETYGYVKAENGLLANQHTILRLSGSEYGSFGTVKEIVHDRMFIFNYNSKDYLVSLNYGSFASGNNGVASALDLLSKQYYYRNDLTSSDNLSVLFQSQYETTYVDQAYVDNAIATIKRNAFISVNTTTYPTLQSFLNSTGEEGYIYLYPLDSQDLSKGYYQYTYENNAWLYLGETNLDLSGYATKEELEDYSTTSESQTYTQNYVATTLQSYDLTIKSWVNGKDYATNSQLNHNVHVEVQQHEFTFNGNTVTYTCSYVNLKTGTTGTRQENIPLANSTTAGMMSSSDYNQIRSNTDRISALEGRQFRLSYTASSSPTATDIKNFVNTYLASVGVTNPTDSDYFSVSVVVEVTKHIWNYYVNDHAYRDDGLDTVSIFTNNVAGIILGTDDNESHTNDGKVYAENDGTGSVLGFDRLSTRVYNLENAGFITASVSNLQNYYDKTYIDTYIATKTWVQQQGYLTSIPSNVAYKDIDNNFSVSQKIYGNNDTPLGLYANTGESNCDLDFGIGAVWYASLSVDSNKDLFFKQAGLATRKVAFTTDILKNAYHLGVADTYSVSNGITTITRKTGYVDLSSLEWGWNSSSSWWYCADLIGIVKPTASNSEIPNVKAQLYVVNNLNTLSNGEIGVNTSGYLVVRNGSSSTKPSGYLEYETISSYTEQVPTDQPLNTLDQNGSEWLRNEWESQLNLLPSDTIWLNHYKIDESTGEMSGGAWYQEYNATEDYISIQPNTTYSFSCVGGTPTRLYFFYYDSAKNFVSFAYADNTFTLTTPSNVAYIRIETYGSGNQGVLSNCMLNKGDHAYPYVPYNKFNGFLKDEYEKTLNLFDINNLNTSSTLVIESQTTFKLYSTYGYNVSILRNAINWKANTQYTFSGQYYNDGSNTRIVIKYTDNSVTPIIPSTTQFTITSDEGKTIADLVCDYGTGGYCEYTNLMLVEGSVALPFEEYNGKIIHEKDLETFESGENLFDINKTNMTDAGASITNNSIVLDSGSANSYSTMIIRAYRSDNTYDILASHSADSYNASINFTQNGNYVSLWFILSGNSLDRIAYYSIKNLAVGTYTLSFNFVPTNYNHYTLSNIMLNKGSTPQPYKEYVGAIVRESTYAHYIHDLIINIQTSSNNTYFIRTSIITTKPTEYTTWEQVYSYLPSQLTSVGTSATQYTTAYLSNFTSSSLNVSGNIQSVVATNSITDTIKVL